MVQNMLQTSFSASIAGTSHKNSLGLTQHLTDKPKKTFMQNGDF
jgi:hypothetical protein